MAKKKTKPAPIWEFEWESGAEEPAKIVQVRNVLEDFLSKLPTNADESGEDSLVVAFALWERYPWFASIIGTFNPAHHEWPNFWGTYQQLMVCHRRAIAILMYHAEKQGIDSGTLFKAAQLCRDVVEKSRNLGNGALRSARWFLQDGICFWPQSINQSRFTVTQLKDIQDGETVMHRLNARLQLSTQKDSPPSVHDPDVVTLDPPQITINSVAFALSGDQALYLHELLKAGDWMSDPEFKKQCPVVGGSAKPHRWRDKLPAEVKSHLQTHQSKGTRWLA